MSRTRLIVASEAPSRLIFRPRAIGFSFGCTGSANDVRGGSPAAIAAAAAVLKNVRRSMHLLSLEMCLEKSYSHLAVTERLLRHVLMVLNMGRKHTWKSLRVIDKKDIGIPQK